MGPGTGILEPPSLEAVRAARERLRGVALRTPCVPFEADRAGARIHLKLEGLQPVGSYKLRGAWNALSQVPREELERGVVTASAGNMAQGVAWAARRLGVPCRVLVPETAPRAKLAAIERLGARWLPLPYEEWWRIIEAAQPSDEGYFLHPVCDPRVVAGNATIALEILEDLPDTEAILVPYGGGGLSIGIAAAAKALVPATRVFACEVETAAPLAAALDAGEPRAIDHQPSFVDGIGGKSVIPAMWPAARSLLDGSLVVSLGQTAEALRAIVLLAHVVAEGAGAVSLAAALSARAPGGKQVCVVSGSHIDPAKLDRILRGEVP